jgi:alcohol dehydrogenase class IV
VSLGGGSAIDTIKAASVAIGSDAPVEELPHLDPEAVRGGIGHISVPTTLSGAELTRVAGITFPDRRGEARGRRRRHVPPGWGLRPFGTYRDPNRIVAGTTMAALDHAVELLYCDTHQPFTDATVVRALELLVRRMADWPPRNEASRADRQAGAALSVVGVANAGFGINHAIAHVLGARYGSPHGIANGIVFPHGMDFNRSASLDRQVEIARTIGVDVDGSEEDAAVAARDRCADLRETVGLPTRLRDVEVPDSDLSAIGADVLEDFTADSNPREVTREACRGSCGKLLATAVKLGGCHRRDRPGGQTAVVAGSTARVNRTIALELGRHGVDDVVNGTSEDSGRGRLSRTPKRWAGPTSSSRRTSTTTIRFPG